MDEEIARLRRQGRQTGEPSRLQELLGDEAVEALDRFARIQLEKVVALCAHSESMSQAGRELSSVSRGQKASTNDADWLREYLSRFGLNWDQVRSG